MSSVLESGSWHANHVGFLVAKPEVERGMELLMASPHFELLTHALTESLASRGRFVIVEGPAGCGKTELLYRFSRHASSVGVCTLWTQARPSGASTALSLIRQILNNPSLSEGAAADFRSALDQARALLRSAEGRLGGTAEMQQVWTALRGLTATKPLLICVDGLQHVDATSMRYLLYIAGRSRGSRLMLAATETPYSHRQDHTHRTEFLRLSHLQRLHMACLESDAVADFVAEYTNSEPDETAAQRYYALTGGNPLLLRALLDENTVVSGSSSSQGRSQHPPRSGAFQEAVLTCLANSGPDASVAADGLAVLDVGSAAELSQICGVSRTEMGRGIRALEAVGIIRGGRFRHPAVRETVLEWMDPERRRQLHGSAAALLRADGAAATEIASHVLVAGGTGKPWEVTVLQEAAEAVLVEGRQHQALQYLEMAHRMSIDERERTSIRIRTAILMRRTNPLASERVAEELLGDLRSGRVALDQCQAVADLLRGQCRFAELDEVNRVESELRSSCASEFAAAPALTSDAPAALTRRPVDVRLRRGWPHADTALLPERHSRKGVGPRLPTGELDAHDVAAAEATLRRVVLNDSTLEPIIVALRCLLDDGKVRKARHWCDLFMRESIQRRANGWYAWLSLLRADIALHLGMPSEAEAITQDALSRLSGRRESVLAGGLIGLQVMAQTALGHYEKSARELNRPPADSLLGSGFGLLYLRARGLHSLATRRPHVALDDFLTVGSMALRWAVDEPAWLPWRGDAAEAWLMLGYREKAKRLVVEQLVMTSAQRTRVRGVSLRLLGAATEPHKRLELLTSAVQKLQVTGDRLELARALRDLAETHRSLGETNRANVATRRAWKLAKECEAEPLCAWLLKEHDESLGQQENEVQGDAGAWTNKLSEAERKVAVLAASGYSNRDISMRLHVTVSTVEQHLTRVYRKLDIAGRQQLPVDMPFDLGGVA
ncbi:helix-turn-helix transcriptional regulator [Streptomyces aculeolatus]|uniref:helix-turn-helix transcriptional regulator n=1 Tax=Streptomyces aculeolatus TaxID=270689 RepID=UPI001CED5135|nr:LuxR family transcriptional regulator [Streptomyces aculeolatus]